MALAGIQWNIPVLSYFISVLMKSKSLAWSSAMPTSSLPDIALSAVLACGLRGERCQSTTEHSEGQTVRELSNIKYSLYISGGKYPSHT